MLDVAYSWGLLLVSCFTAKQVLVAGKGKDQQEHNRRKPAVELPDGELPRC